MRPPQFEQIGKNLNIIQTLHTSSNLILFNTLRNKEIIDHI